jgi:hypothetical protein
VNDERSVRGRDGDGIAARDEIEDHVIGGGRLCHRVFAAGARGGRCVIRCEEDDALARRPDDVRSDESPRRDIPIGRR